MILPRPVPSSRGALTFAARLKKAPCGVVTFVLDLSGGRAVVYRSRSARWLSAC